MKKEVMFNLFVQLFILLVGVNLFYPDNIIKFLISILFIELIFIPFIIKKVINICVKRKYYYLNALIYLVLFIFCVLVNDVRPKK